MHYCYNERGSEERWGWGGGWGCQILLPCLPSTNRVTSGWKDRQTDNELFQSKMQLCTFPCSVTVKRPMLDVEILPFTNLFYTFVYNFAFLIWIFSYAKFVSFSPRKPSCKTAVVVVNFWNFQWKFARTFSHCCGLCNYETIASKPCRTCSLASTLLTPRWSSLSSFTKTTGMISRLSFCKYQTNLLISSVCKKNKYPYLQDSWPVTLKN